MLTGLGTDTGVTARDLNTSEIRELSLTSGAVLEKVRPDSPASRAGIRKRDIVVEFDGEIICSGRQFERVVRETVPGKTVQTTIIRDGHKRELSFAVPRDSHRSVSAHSNPLLSPCSSQPRSSASAPRLRALRRRRLASLPCFPRSDRVKSCASRSRLASLCHERSKVPRRFTIAERRRLQALLGGTLGN